MIHDMGGITSFQDLDAWKEGHQLVLSVYKITKNFPVDERFGMISQIKRAASSITANIAEGFSRYYFKDKIRFYYQARGSTSEVQNFLILSKDLGYIDDAILQDLDTQAVKVLLLTNGLIRSIRNQS